MKWRYIATAAAAVLAIGGGFACGSDNGTGPNSQHVTDVTMTPDSSNVALGSLDTIAAQPVNSAGQTVSGLTLFWSTSDPTIATVSQSGVVTPVAIGTAIIEASTSGVSPSKPARVFVVPTAVASIVVAPSTATVRVGGTLQLTDTTKDASGHVLTGRTVSWTSSNTNVATTDQSGFVVAHRPGTATITASSGSASGTSTITVTLVPVFSIALAPANPTVIVGQTTELAATAKDSAGNVLSGVTIAWRSSNTAVSTVDSTGTVTGVAQGSDTITASNGATSAQTRLTVQAVPINSVLISPQSENLLIGQTLTLTATVTDASGNPITNATVTFSSGATGVATVTLTGALTARVTAVGNGRATITGTSGAKTGTATINVAAVPVRTVLVTPATDSLTQGRTVQLTATPQDSAGNTLTGRAIAWSSTNTSVATVSGTGLVTAAGPGTAVIFATVSGVQGSSAITVRQVPIGSVVLTPSADTVSVGAQKTLTATVKDSLGNTLPSPSVTWSSTNTGVAVVSGSSGSGLVTGVSAGTTRIIALSGAKADTNTTLVIIAQVASVNVTPNPATVIVGQTFTVTATSKDGSGNNLAGRTVTWSSANSSTASVSAGGVDPNTQLDTATVTGAAVGGPVTITAKSSNNVSGTTQVTVSNTPVSYIIVTPNPLADTVNVTRQVTAQAFDAGNNQLTGRTFTWSTKSNGSTSSVDNNGNVTGKAVGNDSVIATSGGKTGAAGVTVAAASVSSIVVIPGTSTITAPNGTQQLADTLKDAGGNILTGRTVTWSSSNTSIATVSNTGLVSTTNDANDTGQVTITAHSGSATGTAIVHVLPDQVTLITVAPPSSTITTAQTAQLTATLKDAGGATITGRTVTWSPTSNPIATVSNTGLVTPNGAINDTGSVTITASNGGVNGTATVRVTNPATTNVTVTPAIDTVYTTAPNNTVALTATTTPTGEPVTWSSDNTSIATVSNTGVVSGGGYGTANVTATAVNNASAHDAAAFLVWGHPVNDSIAPDTATLGGGLTAPVSATLTVALADAAGNDISGQQPVTLTSSDPNVQINGGTTPVTLSPANSTSVTITNAGATGGSTVTITATTLDGHTATCTVTISLLP